MASINKKTIELTDAELKALETLRAHLPDIGILIDQGVFNFKNGRAILHRDHDGKLRRVDVEVTVFRS